MADIFTPGATPVNYNIKANAKGAAFTLNIPQGSIARAIIIRNKTANAVTGGVKVGTTLGGTDVLAAGAVGASAVALYVPLIGAYNAGAARTLYFDAVTAWNSASVDVLVECTDIT